MQCPGQDSRYWDGEAIFESKCPNCGHVIEFFKDDSKRICKNCGNSVFNPRMDFGCASYCPYAEQCLGEMPPELLNSKQELLIDRVALEVKKAAGDDFARVGAAARVARQAEAIVKGEEEANRAVVLIAAHVGTLGLDPDALAARAREILEKIGATAGLIDEVCAIVGAVARNEVDAGAALNSRAVADAHRLAALEAARKNGTAVPADAAALLTATGRTLAGEMPSST